MFTRRQFGKLALAALPVSTASAKISSKIHGVQIGVATYSYNPLPRQGMLDLIISSMVDAGIGDCLLNPPATVTAETGLIAWTASITAVFASRGISPTEPSEPLEKPCTPATPPFSPPLPVAIPKPGTPPKVPIEKEPSGR